MERQSERTEHIVSKLRKLQTHLPKLILGLTPKRMTPRRPEVHHRRPNSDVILIRMGIHIPRIRDLALRRAVHAVDLRASERFQVGERERVGEGVDAGVLEELIACFIDGGRVGVALQIAGVGELAREVVACVEEFEEAAHGVQVFVYEVDAAILWLLSAS